LIKITIPKDPISSQVVELDGDGQEYTLELKWVSKFQRFYMNIYDIESTPLIEGVKLVKGAPLTLPFLEKTGPQGVFILIGEGDPTRATLSSEAYNLYYIPRSDKRFPMVREYTIFTDLLIFLFRLDKPLVV
jgi:hypothetical protein